MLAEEDQWRTCIIADQLYIDLAHYFGGAGSPHVAQRALTTLLHFVKAIVVLALSEMTSYNVVTRKVETSASTLSRYAFPDAQSDWNDLIHRDPSKGMSVVANETRFGI